ncbi:DUF6371 domain-containing protein [Xylanibacter ruminicola]|uniref:DUF6371 domain-containing protein n=1 Tax=Xylanibacter ruminicola TaxID=839 RepID=A0A1M6RAS1_XYLRU|nr:DUF6371 domain-containing protein [Xylanibacter ruminicola]SHK29526.1 hypothetical protein SAMN05216463_101166 [Xylanibacter ruminicola]
MATRRPLLRPSLDWSTPIQEYVNLLGKGLQQRPLWAYRLSAKSCFCRAVVQCGILTHRQMVHAALRYRLGRSKNDAVIYWQIDQLGNVNDGKLMWYGPDCHRLKNCNATWVSFLMKKHCGLPQDTFQPTHVFFGTHLLSNYLSAPFFTGRGAYPKRTPFLSGGGARGGATVCLVEAEKSAIILSELYPQYIWIASGGLFELQLSKFYALMRYKVIMIPDTDPDGKAYTLWYETAQKVSKLFLWPRHNPIYVSDFLERHATADQKRRKIDLVDYILESNYFANANQLANK